MDASLSHTVAAPTLPKGGGSIQGIGEKFQPNAFDGTGSFSIPIPLTGARQGFAPKLALQYSSGSGVGVFGLGWSLNLPRVSRKTDKGLPTYSDADVFVLSGAEDLVPVAAGSPMLTRTGNPPGFDVRSFRPRTEGLFACIERWSNTATGEQHWRVVTKDNVTSIYGRTASARIANPTAPQQVSEWLIEETFDAKGNHLLYRYASDHAPAAVGVGHEVEENGAFTSVPRVSAQRYLRRIFYGNLPNGVNSGVGSDGSDPVDPRRSVMRHYAFEAVFDYGDWNLDRHVLTPVIAAGSYLPPGSAEGIGLEPRPDAVSSFRSGFELRTRLRCERVLMYHHVGAANPLPVKAACFRYANADGSGLAMLAGITVVGYRSDAGGLVQRALPEVVFDYTSFKPGEQRFGTVTARDDEMPPFSLDHPEVALVDVYGEALPAVVHSTPNSFRVWRNRGHGRLERPQPLPAVPSGLALAVPGVGFSDTDGDGALEIVVQTDQVHAAFELHDDLSWKESRYLDHIPVSHARDPNARSIDLTGDGLPDLLITRDHHWLWYQNLGADGYVLREPIERSTLDEHLRDIYFHDPSGRIRLADMTGDGLLDIVRVHWGTVEYWPNLGYGRFGPRVIMGSLPDSPVFDSSFEPGRLFLVDLDGSGCTDLVYVRDDRVDFWFNQCGNTWSDRQVICGTPVAPNGTGIQFADLFGTGTATLVWSRDLGQIPGGSCFALDFCGGVKPNLLVGMNNGLGTETRVTYEPSTEHLQRDRDLGIEWHTRLPFPVHVVSKVEVTDHVSRCRHTTEYRYRHGFYEGREREFRGFAYVEQTDTESFDLFKDGTVDGSAASNINAASHLPPVITKTWFHTGAWTESFVLAVKLRGEFWNGDGAALTLPDHDVPADAEAFRALRGAVLRREIYALDSEPPNAAGSKAGLPYSVTENRYRVQELQARGNNFHGVFHTSTAESVTHHYERNPADPRIAHELQDEPDNFGNITRKIAIAYPRRSALGYLPEQGQFQIVESTIDVINHAKAGEAWWIGVPFQNRSYEISSVTQTAGILLTLADFAAPARKLLAWSRSYFRRDSAAGSHDAAGRLPLGVIETLGLPHETLQAAFPDTLVAAAYPAIVDANAMRDAGYVRESDVANHWWLPSGRVAFAGPFSLPTSSVDAFGNKSFITYDSYALLPESQTDALGNQVKVANDYRVMQPKAIESPNKHVAEVAFDALGRVVATAVRSKDGSEGDDLVGVDLDPTSAQIAQFVSNPRSEANALLGHATTRLVFDLHSVPVFHATIARTEHQSVNPNPEVLLTFAYSDGFGRAAQTKVQAERDPLSGAARWACSGWIVYNNKGKPFRQFEPSFSATHQFEFDARHGVSPYLFYDPLGRVIATLKPDRTWEKVVFNPWQQTTQDAQDNVLVADPSTDPDVGHYFKQLPSTEWSPTWHQRLSASSDPRERDAADKAAAHANTPSVVHLDTLARPVRAVADLGGGRKLVTQTSYDILGNVLTITDPRGIVAFAHQFDLLKRQITVNSVDAGASWLLPDVMNAPQLSGDANGNTVLALYDELRRPTERWLLPPGASDWQLTLKTIYGETASNSAANLRGQVWQVYDGAGQLENEEFDFKAGLRKATRTLWHDPLTQPVWGTSSAPRHHAFDETAARGKLDSAHRYTASSTCDALNRVITSTSPDQSVQRFVFNEASLLNAVHVSHRGGNEQPMVRNIDYNAKGQREAIEYGNGVVTRYTYDSATFRLIHLTSTRRAPAGSDPDLQDIRYTYDAVGNITCIRDEAHDRIFYGSQGQQFVTEPEMRYHYDALYRLISATGREHEAFGACHYQLGDQQQTEFLSLPQATSNHQAIVPYTQQYQYDDGGNITGIRHRRGTQTRWVRAQTYAITSNRILTSGAACDQTQAALAHDANGNLTHLQHLPALLWNDRNQLISAQLNVASMNPDRAFYHYDAAGQRVRKLIQRGGRIEERIYLGGFEVFVVRNGPGISERWESLHLSDGSKRIALIETKTSSDGSAVLDKLIRHQLSNHLDSATVEVDDSPQARVISYEEFTPYGETAYIAGTNLIEVRRKRYRYSGKERDNESGLYYYGARYLAPWMGRWLSSDPAGTVDGLNVFAFCRSNPVRLSDLTGHATGDTNTPNTDTVSPPKVVRLGVRSTYDASQGERPIPSSLRESFLKGFKEEAYKGKGAPTSSSAAYAQRAVAGLDGTKAIWFDLKGVSWQLEQEFKANPNANGSSLKAVSNGTFHTLEEAAVIEQALLTGSHKVDVYMVAENGDVVLCRAGSAQLDIIGNVTPKATGAARTVGTAVGTSAIQETSALGRVLGRFGFGLLAVVGSGLGGAALGTGVLDVQEGRSAEGANKIVISGTSLAVNLGGGKAVEAGALAAGGGGVAVFAVGLVMAGSLILAEQSIEASIHGEKTPIEVAGNAYVDLAMEVQETSLEETWYHHVLQ